MKVMVFRRKTNIAKRAIAVFFFIYLIIYIKAERGGFEPPNRFCRLHAFQACLFSHSSTFPYSEELFLIAATCCCNNFEVQNYCFSSEIP